MRSPISGLIEEIFLQYFETLIIKDVTESKRIIFYARHVDNILIIYDHSKITSTQILDYASTI